MKRMIGICGLVFIATCCPSSGSAHDGTAILTGSALDRSGAVIPDVRVELEREHSAGATYRSSTDGEGVYAFSGLSAGEYTLTLSTLGFARLRLEGILISDGQHKVMPVELGLAQSACSQALVLDHARILESVGDTGEVAGSVTVDQGEMEGHGPTLAGADVRLFCGKKSACAVTKTNAAGEFEFLSLRPGLFSVVVRHRGFYPAGRFEIEVQKGRRQVLRTRRHGALSARELRSMAPPEGASQSL